MMAIKDMQENKEPIFYGSAKPHHKKFDSLLNRRTLNIE